MHLPGADLNFQRFPARPQYYGVDRLITVGFRVGDIVVELIRQMAEVGMHNPQRGIAVLQAFDHHAYRAHVKQLVKRQRLLLHLAPDAVNVFWTAVDVRLDAFIDHRITQRGDEIVNKLFAIDAAFVQQLGDAFVLVRMQVAEAEIFQFPFELPDTQTVSQRRIDIRTLFCRQHALVFRRIFHFAQVCDTLRQLDDHAAEILHHRQQHAAHVVDLFGGHRIVLSGFQLADGVHIAYAMHQIGDALAELFGQGFFLHDAGIHQREQQRGAHAVVIHAQSREDLDHFQPAPQQQRRIRMVLGLLLTVTPGCG
ncbi:hypothetical protein D3C72_1064490 [compost metagenome]